jgi:hypothetical protein
VIDGRIGRPLSWPPRGKGRAIYLPSREARWTSILFPISIVIRSCPVSIAPSKVFRVSLRTSVLVGSVNFGSVAARVILSLHTTPEEAGRVFSRMRPRLAVYSHIVLVTLPRPLGVLVLPKPFHDQDICSFVVAEVQARRRRMRGLQFGRTCEEIRRSYRQISGCRGIGLLTASDPHYSSMLSTRNVPMDRDPPAK